MLRPSGVSEVTLEGEAIRWEGDGLVRAVDVHESDLLRRFLALATVREKELGAKVLAFARAFGVLGLCQHGLPFGHLTLDGETTHCRWSTREPLALWHLFAREALAIRTLGKALLRRDIGAREDWRALVRAWLHRNHPRVTTRRRSDIEQLVDMIVTGTPAERRSILARSIEAGLVDAGVRPSLTWDDGIHVRLTNGTGVTAVVARTLLFEITSADDGPTMCANCGGEIAAHRRWCSKPECRQASRAQATRDHRARKRAKKGAVVQKLPKGKKKGPPHKG